MRRALLDPMKSKRIIVVRKTRPILRGILEDVSYDAPEHGLLIRTTDEQFIFVPFDQIVEAIADAEA